MVNSPDVVNTLVNQHVGLIRWGYFRYTVALHSVGRMTLKWSKELESDLFQVLLQCAKYYQPKAGSFSNYFIKSVRQYLLDYNRRKKKDVVFDNSPEDIDDYDVVENTTTEEEKFPPISLFLKPLNQRERSFVTLYYLEGTRMEDIAMKFNISRQRVHKIIQEAIKKMQQVRILT
jgi:RNA polymerase sigma factor (sigma-70 family)